MTLTHRDVAGYPVWRDRRLDERGTVEILFTGRGSHTAAEAAKEPRQQVLAAVESTPPALAMAKQIHSDLALPAQPGHCGEGDALFTTEPDLALSVITADCVPVLLAGKHWLAAVHAGWRGLASGVLARTLEHATEDTADLTAWIGPAIGPCCYEVSPEVADEVAHTSRAGGSDNEPVVVPGKAERPHLDLHAAARNQLRALGLDAARVHSGPDCTRCRDDVLWSYRREGKRAGRNMAFIWRRS